MQNRLDSLNQRDITIERIFLIANFVVELPSAVFDQLTARQKPQYALISMIMSLAIMLISIIDLARIGRKQRVKWMIRGLKPWFYSPYPSYKPLGTFADVVGFICAIFQFVFATIAYVYLSKNAATPIHITVWPIIFAFGVLCSRFPRKPPRVSPLERIEIAQRMIHGLNPNETALLFRDENYAELSEFLEEAKQRAETARLIELHTLKGQVESKAKLKGLDIGTHKRQYSV